MNQVVVGGLLGCFFMVSLTIKKNGNCLYALTTQYNINLIKKYNGYLWVVYLRDCAMDLLCMVPAKPSNKDHELFQRIA